MRLRSPTVVGALVALALSCKPPVFACEEDEQCATDQMQGFCEPNGHCSFPDGTCASGRRFGSAAPQDIAGRCVDEALAGSDGSTGPNQSGATQASTSATSDADNGSAQTGPSGTTGPPQAPWWDADWSVRHRLSFNNGAQTSELTALPVLVILDADRVDYRTTKPDGADIRFVDEDGTTVLAHEIETWTASGTSFVWVGVPQVDAGSNTDHIWLYYGNDTASDAQNASAVWDEQYRAVWHLSDLLDSTSNDNDLGPGTATMMPGQVGAAHDFDGTDVLSAGSPAVLDAVFASGGTLEAWIRTEGVGASGEAHIVDKSTDPTGADGYWLGVQGTGESLALAFVRGFVQGGMGMSTNVWSTASGTVFSSSVWQHIAVTFDDSDPDSTFAVYIDGAAQGFNSGNPGTEPVADGAATMSLGNHASAQGAGFVGCIDEVRVSTTVRSPQWLLVQYWMALDAFVTFGPRETSGDS